jgi:hypothetical protein
MRIGRLFCVLGTVLVAGLQRACARRAAYRDMYRDAGLNADDDSRGFVSRRNLSLSPDKGFDDARCFLQVAVAVYGTA